METTEKIVESYCRYVKGWFTITNIKCGLHEIDILAVDLSDVGNCRRYHIECGIHTTGAFAKLTANPFSPELFKKRASMAQQRRTIGYYVHQKFNAEPVVRTLGEYGFRAGNYANIIVSMGWTPEAKAMADAKKIELWDFRSLIREIAEKCRGTTYFTDDTLRTLQLFVRANEQ